MNPISNENIARKTAEAAFWNYLSFGLGKGLVFVTTAILTRLLTRADFGLVAFATLAVNYLAILKDFGLGSALIQKQDKVEASANAVFTLNLGLGIFLTAITAGIAPFVAVAFNEPQVAAVLRWLGLTFVINALGSVHIVRLQRELKFRRKLAPDLGRSLIKGVVSIGLALSGFGVWALVWGQLAGAAASVILAWFVFRWTPKLQLDREVSGDLLRFGSAMLGVDALAVVSDNMDYLLIGSILGKISLGVYTLAYRLPELLVMNILWVLAAAIFPAYSKIQNNRSLLRRGFLITLRYVELAAIPLSLGLIITAEPLVQVAYGDKWLDAIPVVRTLGLLMMVRSIGTNVGDIYKAIGRPDILVKLGVLNTIILTIALLIGIQLGGIVGVAWGHVAAGILRTAFRLAYAARFIDFSYAQILAELKPAVLGGLALTCTALPALWLTATLPALFQLILVALLGGSVYLAVIWLLEKNRLIEAKQLLAKI